jgi:hypothetical protein
MWDVGFRVADADGALGLARVRLNAELEKLFAGRPAVLYAK